MRRRLFLGLMIVLSAAALWLFFPREPVTPEKARALAIDAFERSAQQLRFDAARFDGPRPTAAVNVPYGFEWTFSDEKGRVSVIIWVDDDGWTTFAADGPLERLRTTAQPSP
jgi:hypothetical protein